jgi:hypothetical protein
MPSILENEAMRGLLQLNPKTTGEKTKYQVWYEMRCRCLKKARETRLAKLAARKKRTPTWKETQAAREAWWSITRKEMLAKLAKKD